MNESRDNAETSFAEAFEASLNFKPIEQGELLRGTVVSISGDDAFVSYGGPSEAIISVAEIEGLNVGDTVEAMVVSTSPLRLSRKVLAGRASLEALRQAKENRLPVEGKITGRNKGGFDVNVSGMRAFCPLSQIEMGKVDNPDQYLNRNFEFRITELSDDGRKFVVSRTALMREESAARADETRKAILPGATLQGTVRSIMPFGAFVDLGGVDGLVHVSEMSRRRVNDPKEIVTVGQQVTVKVLKIDDGGKRISLSMKETEPDPWEAVAEKYAAGSEFVGKVARSTDFGIFVELEPGIDGLVHISQFPIGMKASDESLQPGAMVRGWVREVDAQKKRLSLAMREVATSDPWGDVESKYPIGRAVEATVERAGQPGLFVQVEAGLTGLIPISELGLAQGADVARSFPAGQKLNVQVIGVDGKRKRLTLSVQAAKGAAERGEYLSYVEETNKQAGEGKTAMQLALEKALKR